MYKTLSEDSIKRGKSRKSLIAACFYYSCKDKNISRSTKEISDIFDLKVKKMTSGCKQFNEMMYHNNLDYSSNIEPTTPENFIERYGKKLGINKIHRDRACHVAKIAQKLGIVSENTPPSIAVGSLYLITLVDKIPITKKRFSDICDISEVTISKTYKKMNKFRKFLLPEGETQDDEQENDEKPRKKKKKQ